MRGKNSESLLLDVGANTGSFSLLPALLPGLKVAAFEPLPSALELLVANVAVNGLNESVEVNAMALSNQEQSSAPLQAQDDHATVGGGLSTLASSANRINDHAPEASITPILVKVSTLDAWMNRRALNAASVDVLKIDVEGWELFVLRGGRKLIERDRPTILIEREEHNMAQAGVTDDALDAELALIGYGCLLMGSDNQWCTHNASTQDLEFIRRYSPYAADRGGVK